ncbi:unnamed protein product [Phytomonas sp. EM1]|nr:unnamed protein product [Phytomonas sp. EM1]|eukprot:CCW65022.1 unnamed protein product [Phytomonas sp. isolate EM1]
MNMQYLFIDPFPCSLEKVMDLSPEALCRAAWARLPVEGQYRPASDLLFTPPMRISASAAPNESAFRSSIEESAHAVARQLEKEDCFADEPDAICFRLRSALFAHLLEKAREEKMGLAGWNARDQTVLDTCEASSYIQPGARNASDPIAPYREPQRAAEIRHPRPSSGRAAATGSPTMRRSLSSPGASAGVKKSDEANLSGSDLASPEADYENDEAEDGLAEVVKPSAVVLLLYSEVVEMNVVVALMAEMITPLTVMPHEGPGEFHHRKKLEEKIVLTAAALALAVPQIPLAGAFFTHLLDQLLRAEQAIQRAGSSPSSAVCHHRLVVNVLLPVLHFIPLVEWPLGDLRALGELLVTATMPSVRLNPLSSPLSTGEEGPTGVEFTVEMEFSLNGEEASDVMPVENATAASSLRDPAPQGANASLSGEEGGGPPS